MKQQARNTDVERQQTAWAFVEANYPNYSSCDKIAYIDDLSKIVNGECEDGDSASKLERLLEITTVEQAQELLNQALVDVYERAIVAHAEAIQRKTDNLLDSQPVGQYLKKFARRCDATGKGMNEGYVVADGELYFSEEKYLVEWLRSRGGMEGLTDEYILDEAYGLEEYYYTEWEDEDDFQYVLLDDGSIVELDEYEPTK